MQESKSLMAFEWDCEFASRPYDTNREKTCNSGAFCFYMERFASVDHSHAAERSRGGFPNAAAAALCLGEERTSGPALINEPTRTLSLLGSGGHLHIELRATLYCILIHVSWLFGSRHECSGTCTGYSSSCRSKEG